jgi:hypothetical protein
VIKFEKSCLTPFYTPVVVVFDNLDDVTESLTGSKKLKQKDLKGQDWT